MKEVAPIKTSKVYQYVIKEWKQVSKEQPTKKVHITNIKKVRWSNTCHRGVRTYKGVYGSERKCKMDTMKGNSLKCRSQNSEY